VAAGRWAAGQALVSNLLRRFKSLCRRAGVGPYALHDLRRSCITNWAGRLPIHVVQQLAGHSDIGTTERYCLSVRAEDLQAARRLASELLGPTGARDQACPFRLAERGQIAVYCFSWEVSSSPAGRASGMVPRCESAEQLGSNGS